MAYPSHISTGTPHTPRHVKASDVSRSSMHRTTLPTPVFRRKATLLWLVFSILLVWWIGLLFRSTSQTDKIPFSHGPIEEQVIHTDFPWDPTNPVQAILITLRDTKTAASYPPTSMFDQRSCILMSRGTHYIAQTVQSYSIR